MALAIVPILLIIIGIIIYAWAHRRTPPAGVWQEVGRAMFFAGFIGLAVGYAHKMINIG